MTAGAAAVLRVLEVAETDVVPDGEEVAEGEELTEGGLLGVPAGQSEPASAGGVHGMISKKTGEHWAPRLASYKL